MQNDTSNIYVWFDTEFTTLDLEDSHLLQVAAVLTNEKLERIAPASEDLNLIVALPDGLTCSPWVEENLSDLLAQCRSESAVSAESVDSALVAYIDRHVPDLPDEKVMRPVLAGNSIHSDWYLARKWLPGFLDRLNYRVLDVSSWKIHWKNTTGANPFDKDELAAVKAYFPSEFNATGEKHDAHFDVLASIAEMNYYATHSTILGAREG